MRASFPPVPVANNAFNKPKVHDNKSNNNKPTSSSHRCCAERRLLQFWEAVARKHGVPQHRVVTWVRRKIGPDLLLLRYTSDGCVGCAVPCVFCHRVLIKYDLRVHCCQPDGLWFSGRLDEPAAPLPMLTSGQRRQLGLWLVPPTPDDKSAPHRAAQQPQLRGGSPKVAAAVAAAMAAATDVGGCPPRQNRVPRYTSTVQAREPLGYDKASAPSQRRQQRSV